MGFTTWYQSVPGSNTLGTWEVIHNGFVSLDRDFDVVSHVMCLIDNMLMCLSGYGFLFLGC